MFIFQHISYMVQFVSHKNKMQKQSIIENALGHKHKSIALNRPSSEGLGRNTDSDRPSWNRKSFPASNLKSSSEKGGLSADAPDHYRWDSTNEIQQNSSGEH